METLPRSTKYLVITGVGLLLYPMTKPVFMPNYRYPIKDTNRTVVVTGASGNIGAELCRFFAMKQFRVIMACRDLDKCKSVRRQIVIETASRNLACRKLDLEDIDSINTFADEVIKTEPHIDVLINLAAVKDVKTKELTKYGVEKNYFVNFVAPFLLTMRLMPKLEESAKITKDSRVVNVTGRLKKSWDVDLKDINFEKRKYTSKSAYRQSKTALAYFTVLLNEFNKEKRNSVYVFGADPVYKRIADSRFRPTTEINNLTNYAVFYWRLRSEFSIGNIVRGAVSDQEFNGKLFGIFGHGWDWRKKPPLNNTMKGLYVWNSAAEILLNSDKIKSEQVKSSGNQEKLQGNNSAGSADVSAAPGKVSA